MSGIANLQEAALSEELPPRASAVALAIVATADADGVCRAGNAELADAAEIRVSPKGQSTDVSRTLRVLRTKGLIQTYHVPWTRIREIHVLHADLVSAVLGIQGRTPVREHEQH